MLGILEAAGLLFFAFAGYARIATLAEEVRSPATLGRAILLALGFVVVLYAVVAVVLLETLGARGLAASPTPIAAAVDAAGAAWAEPVVRLGAAAASLGALLALLAGVGRTTLAMAREGDLPRTLASVDPRHQVPDHAQLLIGAAIVALVLVVDLRGAIGFSSFGVLVYYSVANLSALRQPPDAAPLAARGQRARPGGLPRARGDVARRVAAWADSSSWAWVCSDAWCCGVGAGERWVSHRSIQPFGGPGTAHRLQPGASPSQPA